jgi:RNA polymerase sigma-70 factor (ECF subfamily)
MDEKQQIRKVLRGDLSAFGYFVDTCQDMALTIAYRICNNRQDAEDIVQDSFVKAFHNLHTFKSDSRFSTWFYRIVYNTALTALRNVPPDRRFVDLEETEMADSYVDPDTLEGMDEAERQEMLNRALDRMPRDERLILSLFYLEENSVREVAKITGLTVSNTRVKLHRARKRMYQIMKELVK